MNKFVTRGILMTTIVGTLGCGSIATEDSDKVDQSRIFPFYEVQFSKEEEVTRVSAEFRFGGMSGTTLRLVGKSQVKHSQISLVEKQLLGTSYSGERAGLVAEHVFNYFDNERRNYENVLTITGLTIASSVPRTTTRTSDLNIAWEGNSLSEGESVIAHLKKIDDPNSSAIGIITSSGVNSVVIRSSDLARLPIGRYVLQLERKKEGNLLHAASVGGVFSSRYFSEKRTVEIQ